MNIGGVFGDKCWSGSGDTGHGGIICFFGTLGGVCCCGIVCVRCTLGGVGCGGITCAIGTLGDGAGFSVGEISGVCVGIPCCCFSCMFGNRAGACNGRSGGGICGFGSVVGACCNA
eukprot:14046262-Ditylum_brightwellii.AAC.1